MNAMVRAPRFTHEAICWRLSQLPPGSRVTDLARVLGWSVSATSLRLSQLKHLDLVERRRGSTTLTPRGIKAAESLPVEPSPAVRSGECNEPVAPRGLPLTSAPLEPRGSNPMPLLVDALALHQDALLARANELLRRRVLELEAEVADLKDQRAKALQRLGFVCDALSG